MALGGDWAHTEDGIWTRAGQSKWGFDRCKLPQAADPCSRLLFGIIIDFNGVIIPSIVSLTASSIQSFISFILLSHPSSFLHTFKYLSFVEPTPELHAPDQGHKTISQ